VKIGVNSEGTGRCGIEVRSDKAMLTNVIIAGLERDEIWSEKIKMMKRRLRAVSVRSYVIWQVVF